MGPFGAAYGDRRGPQTALTPDERLAALASKQLGVVSAAQLYELGFTRQAVYRRVRKGRLHRLHTGVYAVGHLSLKPPAGQLAAVLACGSDALLSHDSAVALWGLVRTYTGPIHVTAPRARKPRAGLVVHRSRLIHPDDRAVSQGVPVTSVARTLVDFADVAGPARLARAVDQAEILRLFDLGQIDRTLERLPKRPGRGALARVLAAYVPDVAFTRSRGERDFLRLCRDHGLPAPQANLWIHEQELDFFWADAALGIELDGEPWHRTTRAFHEDRSRDRVLATYGIQVNRVTQQDLKRPAALARELKAIRARRLAMPR